MVIKGNGAVNTMEAVKINTKEKERTKVTYHKSVFSSVLTGITWGAAILALAVLVFLVGFILIHGVKNLTLEQFAWTYNTENVTMLPAIINTVTMTVLSLLLAAPLGIFSAIYLVEYANKRGKLVGLIRITAETLSRLKKYHIQNKNTVTVLSAMIDDPTGYGRIIRDADGNFVKSVEHKDANEQELKSHEINSGMYIFDTKELKEALGKLQPNNAQGEYYLPDTLTIIKNKGLKADAFALENAEDITGVNDQQQLAEAAKIIDD